MKKIKNIFVTALLFLSACSKSDSDKIVLPSNLQIDVTMTDPKTGQVQVKATAQNTNFFVIFFSGQCLQIFLLSGFKILLPVFGKIFMFLQEFDIAFTPFLFRNFMSQ